MWNDVGKLKRRLIDDITTQRNDKVKDIMDEVEAISAQPRQ